MNKQFFLKDRHGNNIYFGNFGDFWGPPVHGITDCRQHTTKVRHMELRDGDVIIASFPRSGTFWHHQILSMLIQDTTDYVGQMLDDHLETRKPFEKLSRPDGPQVFATHIPRFHLLPTQVKEKGVKVIYAYRNPKDTWVSFYSMAIGSNIIPAYQGTWSHFFDLMMDCGYWYGDWFDHVLDYEKAATDQPGKVFLSCYELMKKDPVEQIWKINQFLGLNRSRQLCEGIAEACQFSKMKTAKEAQKPELFGNHLWKPGSAGFYRKGSGRSNVLAMDVVCTGEVGDWKNWFTVAQSQQLDDVFNQRMTQSTLPFFFQ